MAQKVHFMEDNVVFTEGPFVLDNACSNGWRVEVELKGHKCPVLPDLSIYQLLRTHRLSVYKSFDLIEMERICDWLNEMVRKGAITLAGRCWVWEAM